MRYHVVTQARELNPLETELAAALVTARAYIEREIRRLGSDLKGTPMGKLKKREDLFESLRDARKDLILIKRKMKRHDHIY